MKLSVLRLDLKQIFASKNIDTKDVDYILSEVLNVSITELFKEREISNFEQKIINKMVKKRIKGMPVSKIFGYVNFYGLHININKNVLSPRPETELLVEETLKILKGLNENISVLDLCTGSGAIACAIKKNFNAKLVATDISSKALNVAKKNSKRLGLDIQFIKSNMFDKIYAQFDVIVSNPPYIETETCKTLDLEVKNYDPSISLDGGEDGLDYYKIIAQNLDKLKIGGFLILEIGYNQGEKVSKLFDKCQDVKVLKDYNDLDRIVIVKK